MEQTHQTFSGSNNESSLFANNLHLEQAISLYSQPSLPSVPSLTFQPHYKQSQKQLLKGYHRCITTIKSCNSYTSSLMLSEKFLFTGSSNKEIRLWKLNVLAKNTVNCQNVMDNTIMAGKGAVKSIAVLADNKVFTAHQDHKIRVWKIEDPESACQKMTRLATLPTLGDRFLKLFVPKNHVQIRRHKKSTWVHHVDAVSALALSSDESLLYSVSWDRTLKVWRTTDFKCLESITNAHDDAINSIALSKDNLIYTGSSDKKIKVWKQSSLGKKKHSLVATLEKHKSGINTLALSKDGLVLYSGACDRSILVWKKEGDNDNMVVVGALRGHTKSILCLAVVLDLVCSGSEDKSVRIWRRENKCYCCLAVLEGHTGPVKCMAVAYDDQFSSNTSSRYLVYTASLDSDIKIWHMTFPLEILK